MSEDKRKIVWAESTVVEALDIYVREILQALADKLNSPGMAKAFVSDESKIWDFAYNNEEKLPEISKFLGIELTFRS